MAKEVTEVGSMNFDALVNKTIDVRPIVEESEEASKKELKNALSETINVGSSATDTTEEEEIPETEEKQPEEEDNDPPSVDTEIDKKGKEVPENSELYDDVLKGILGDDYKDILIDVDGEEVPLSELEMDAETLKEVLTAHINDIQEKSSQGKVSVEKLSTFTKALIDIEKNGGDISEVLQERKEFGDPLDKVDLTTATGQKEAIRLRLKAGGHTDDHINRLIKSYESEGNLEEFAIAAHDELRAYIDEKVQQQVETSKELVERRKELMKGFRKDLKENLSVFQLKEPLKNKIVELATKEDAEGKFAMDKLYREWRSNPQKAAKLALFLLDEEEFVKQVTNEVVTKKTLESAKKRLIVKRDPSAGNTSKTDKKDNQSIPFTELQGR